MYPNNLVYKVWASKGFKIASQDERSLRQQETCKERDPDLVEEVRQLLAQDDRMTCAEVGAFIGVSAPTAWRIISLDLREEARSAPGSFPSS